jgi:hypothetical protein
VNDAMLLELAAIISIFLFALSMLAHLFGGRERQLEARVVRLEARLYRLMRHNGVPDPAEELEETRRQAKDGNRARAIAAYRKVTGASEADAAKVVEGMLPKSEKK